VSLSAARGAEVEIAAAQDPADRAAAYAIRQAVFVDEQRVPVELERDADDDRAAHVLGRVAGVPAATARVVVAPERTAVVGRVAVLPAFRSCGLGRAVMAAIEAQAAVAGAYLVELHAQLPARGFYERLGYAAVGAEYDEAGIRHVTMRKSTRG
jgi:predicted GNAT family N-acyltransferase